MRDDATKHTEFLIKEDKKKQTNTNNPKQENLSKWEREEWIKTNICNQKSD